MNNVQQFHHIDADLSASDDEVITHVGVVAEPPAGEPGQEPLNQDSDRDIEPSSDDPPTPPLNDPPTPPLNDPQTPAVVTKDKKKAPKHDGSSFRKRRGRKSQVEDAIDKSISKLIEAQQQQRDESTDELVKLEQERLQWEQSMERERERRIAEQEAREHEYRMQQLAADERRRNENNQLLLQFAHIFGNAMQGGRQNSNYGHGGPSNNNGSTYWHDL
ncbi:troponin T, cardiac muscle-like [Anneissia japonica]|uniref:troponin T, cardiac muscle-like n=1 Tax=Anneissia japonica TaxID=1529436 RepID=UPI0014256765|nr:troponin T, cardiac muscle-like [Anneissia japonica]